MKRSGFGLWTLPKGKLVLGSGSPRRRMLLEQQGLRFEVLPADIEENFEGRSPPRPRPAGWPSRRLVPSPRGVDARG